MCQRAEGLRTSSEPSPGKTGLLRGSRGTPGRRQGDGQGDPSQPGSPPGAATLRRPPVRIPFLSPGSCQLTFSEVSRTSLKLRCPTGPGTAPREGPPPHPRPVRASERPPSAGGPAGSRGTPGWKTRAGLPCAWSVQPGPWAGGRMQGVRGRGSRDRGLPTILMGAHQLRGAAGPIPGGGEAQHRGEVLRELLQAGHEAHVNAVLKVGPGGHHGNLLFLLRLPGDELQRGQALEQGGKNGPSKGPALSRRLGRRQCPGAQPRGVPPPREGRPCWDPQAPGASVLWELTLGGFSIP